MHSPLRHGCQTWLDIQVSTYATIYHILTDITSNLFLQQSVLEPVLFCFRFIPELFALPLKVINCLIEKKMLKLALKLEKKQQFLLLKKPGNNITRKETLVSWGLNLNFKGESSLGSLMPSSRQGEF